MSFQEKTAVTDATGALVKAVENDDIVGMMAALKGGADPNVRDPATGRTLLYTVLDRMAAQEAEGRSGSILAGYFCLMQNGTDARLAGDDGVAPFHYALDRGSVLVAETVLLLANENPNRADPRTGDTPLHRALPLYLANRNDLDPTLMEVLVKMGADPAVPNKAGVTALDLARAAAGERAVKAVEMLMETAPMRQRRLRAVAKNAGLKLK